MNKMTRFIAFFSCFISIFIGLFAFAENDSSVGQADIMIINAKVVSPPNKVQTNATIIIKGKYIDYVGVSPPKTVAKRTIDAKGKTVTPGLIDVHAHILAGAGSAEEYNHDMKEKLPEKLQNYLQSGITTVVSAGEYWPNFKVVVNKLKAGELTGPRVLISGPIITIENGHPGDTEGCVHSTYCGQKWGWSIPRGEQGVRQAIRELAADKVDLIKIMYDGKYVNNFSVDELAAMIDETHKLGLKASVHAIPTKQAIEAIELGADILLHGPGLIRIGKNHLLDDDKIVNEFITVAKKYGTPIATTISPLMVYTDYWGEKRLLHTGIKLSDFPEGVSHIIDKFADKAYADVQNFTRQGLELVFGTDTWHIPPLISRQKEMEALRQAGLTPKQIIQIATYNAAKAIGRASDLGSIEAGKLADLLIMDGNPLARLTAFDNIEWVIQEGEVSLQTDGTS
jgi:imidazolonepropionase-like amidohydrolase